MGRRAASSTALGDVTAQVCRLGGDTHLQMYICMRLWPSALAKRNNCARFKFLQFAPLLTSMEMTHFCSNR